MQIMRHLALKLIRLYFRYTPYEFAKYFMWYKIVDPIFNNMPYRAVCSTKYGTKHAISFPDVIQKYIYYFGVWEPTITKYIRNNLNQGDIFIDIGANIGYYSCIAAKVVGETGIVYSVEASPSIYRLLLDSIKLNNINNIKTKNVAVYNKFDKMYLHKHKDNNIGASTMFAESMDMSDFTEKEEVSAMPLDHVIPERDLFSARIIKIDIEGAEWFVIDGIRDKINKFSPETEWIVEINPEWIKNIGSSFQEFLEIFFDNGYRAYEIRNNYSPVWYMTKNESDHIYPLEMPIEYPKDILFTKRHIETTQ